MFPDHSPKISVVISTHNNEPYIAKALDSIFLQKHSYSFEIIICDDASTDRTRDYINSYYRKYPDIITRIYQDKSIGMSFNSLHAISLCRGKYIAFLEGNDYWTDPEKIQKQVSFLDQHPEYVLSCHRFKRQVDDSENFLDDFHPVVFKDKPEGIEFSQQRYFDFWLTQTSTVVIRNSALHSIPVYESYKYYWDSQFYWTLLLEKKGYAHAFYGSVYRTKGETSGKKFDLLKQNSLTNLIIHELRRAYPENAHIKRIFEVYQKNLKWSKSAHKGKLDLSKIKNKNFTIISDDGWGEEVYKAFDIPYQTPFIGIHIFNEDFVKLTTYFEVYINFSLEFIDPSQSKHRTTFKHCFEKNYPIALLGGDIELHFTGYTSEKEASKLWNERKRLINPENLYFKMDASRENNNQKHIDAFVKINRQNKVCFLNTHDFDEEKQSETEALLIDYWNPVSEIFFPLSISSFDLIGWLNGKSGRYNAENPYCKNIFIPSQKREHFFIQFDKENIESLDAKFHPETHKIYFNEESESAVIDYDKSDLEYFCLGAQEIPHPRNLDLFIDLSKCENRHIMVLAKGKTGDQLRIDFIGKEEDEKDTILHIDDIIQPLSEDYQWLHYDFSFVNDKSTEYLFSRVRSFYFYLNPKSKGSGQLELLAFYAGSLEKFEEVIN